MAQYKKHSVTHKTGLKYSKITKGTKSRAKKLDERRTRNK
jgi:hypothetical protein